MSLMTEAESKQPQIIKQFNRIINNHRLSHAYLFCGEAGSGKLAVAKLIAMRLFCPHVKNGLPCGKCNYCQRIMKDEHPDVLIVKPQGTSIKIEQIRNLEKEFTRSPVEGNRRIFIIDGADLMTTNAMNSLLKFIEEPKGNITSFLLTNRKASILPTIISRTQVINFPRISPKVFINELSSAKINPNEFNLLATMTSSIDTAKKLNVNNWFSKLQTNLGLWLAKLTKNNPQAFIDVQTKLVPLVKKPLEKKIAMLMFIQFWRDIMNYKYEKRPTKGMNFPQFYNVISSYAQKISERQLLYGLKIALHNDKLLRNNVNFQSILESTTLKLMTPIGK